MNTSKRILMVLTSHDRIDAQHATGLWLEEFAVPYLEFSAQGCAIDVASIRGGRVPVDPRSAPNADQQRQWEIALRTLNSTLVIGSVKADDYDAVFLPGGHGTMFDLPLSADLKNVLDDFARADKVIAAVCHGPAGLVGVTRPDGKPLVAGKRVAGFTNDEERAAGLEAAMPFLLETKLRELGANFVVKPNWSDHVEQDGALVTGQNPQSSKSAARAVIALLRV